MTPAHVEPAAEPDWAAWRQRVKGAPSDVVVYLVDLRAVSAWAARELTCLSDEEGTRADIMRNATRRRDYLASHVVLRNLLARHLDCPPGKVVLARDPVTGAPAPAAIASDATGARPTAIRYSLARAPGHTAIVIGNRPVGIDLEARQRPQQAEALLDMLHPRDQTRLGRLPSGLRRRAVTDAWVRVEALLKARGVGLATDPATVPVTAARRMRHPDGVLVTGVRTPHGAHLHAAVAWQDMPLRDH